MTFTATICYNMSRMAKTSTISDLFCDTYIRVETQNCYIMLPALLTNRALARNPSSILAPTGLCSNLVEIEGIPAYRIRHKFHKTIRARGDSVIGLYGALSLVFTENAIKSLFTMPNVWLLNHNALAKKKRATEISELNHQRKVNPSGFRLHTECLDRTKNLSIDKTVRLQRRMCN